MLKNKSCFWGHKWSKWVQYEETMHSPKWKMDYIEYRQKRVCEKCNKVQIEAIKAHEK